MAANQAGYFNVQEFTSAGDYLVGGRLYTYEYGTTTHKIAYTDAAGSTSQTYTSDGAGGQYIALDARGEVPAPLYLTSGSYDICLKTAAGATIWTRRADPITFVDTAIQTQLYSAFTSGGTSTAYTLTPSPAITAYAENQRFAVEFHTASGASPTLAVSGLATKNLKYRDSAGTKVAVASGDIPSGWRSDIIYDGTDWIVLDMPIAAAAEFSGTMFIQGFTYSNNSGDATNDIDIAAGSARDSADANNIVLTSSITKQSDVAWAVGTSQGGLDTGVVGNSDYYIWAIKRTDTGVVDVLFSLSSTSPTMPTNYTPKRLIGWFKRVAGTVVAFHVYETGGGGIYHLWDVPTLDVNLSNTLTTSRRTDAMKVPLNFSTIAHINAATTDVTTGNQTWICCPDQTDAASSQTVAPLNNLGQVSTTMSGMGNQLHIRTSSTGTIAARNDIATVDLYAVSTMGFAWGRRN